MSQNQSAPRRERDLDGTLFDGILITRQGIVQVPIAAKIQHAVQLNRRERDLWRKNKHRRHEQRGDAFELYGGGSVFGSVGEVR